MNWHALLLEPVIMSALVEGRAALRANNQVNSAASFLAKLAACLGVIAALFLCAGGYLWLDELYGPRLAALIMGGVVTGLALITVFASWYIMEQKRKKIIAYQKEATDRAEAIMNTILEYIEKPVQAYPKTAVTAAAVAGYMTSEKMQDGTELLLRTFERLRA